MEEEEKINNEKSEEKVKKVKDTILTSKTAALGFAVLFATSTLLSGCGKKPIDKNGDGIISQEELKEAKEEEEDRYYYGGGYHGSYFRYSGNPETRYKGGYGKSFWSGSTSKSSGYSFFRGGSSGG